MKLTLINGPPNSGKDYLGGQLNKMLVKFKTALVEDTIKEYNINEEDFKIACESRERKDKGYVEDMTPREMLIRTASKVKYFYGPRTYGIALGDVLSINNNYVVTDTGFIEEVDGLINQLLYKGAKEINIDFVRLYAEGCNFSNDSRSYLAREDIKRLGRKANVHVTETSFTNYKTPASVRSFLNKYNN